MVKINQKKPFRLRCKYCHTTRYVIPIGYGLWLEEWFEKEEAGQIRLGGVARSVDTPNWHCSKCGNEFLR